MLVLLLDDDTGRLHSLLCGLDYIFLCGLFEKRGMVLETLILGHCTAAMILDSTTGTVFLDQQVKMLLDEPESVLLFPAHVSQSQRHKFLGQDDISLPDASRVKEKSRQTTPIMTASRPRTCIRQKRAQTGARRNGYILVTRTLVSNCCLHSMAQNRVHDELPLQSSSLRRVLLAETKHALTCSQLRPMCK